MSGRRTSSLAGRLARTGFDDSARAARLVASPVFAGLLDSGADDHGLLAALGAVPDPDLALLGLVRLLEAATDATDATEVADTIATTDVAQATRGADGDDATDPITAKGAAGAGGARDARGPDAAPPDLADLRELRELLTRDETPRRRLLALLGSSAALGEHLARHPGQWRCVTDAGLVDAASRTRRMLDAVSAANRGERSGEDTLRLAYREQLLGIAGLDVACADPTITLPQTSEALADLAGAALEAALALAAEQHPEAAEATRLAVIGLGKCGGRELNYVSDVDVVFVAEPADGHDDESSLAAGAQLAAALMRACSAATAEGTLWPVDAALRPEGKNGPLVRSVASHEAYYRRWAKTWEFQALLKARTVAGDREVGARYLDAVRPLVWEAAGRPNFVEDVQAMRRRVEEHVPTGEAERQIKLGPGGLRDVEFTVQLLQLVHGRTDVNLRSATTLTALGALSRGGYVGREDAVEFDHSYRLLRSLEHRIQLYKMRRTHLMPTRDVDLRRLGRGIGLRADPAAEVLSTWRAHKRDVRRLHQRIFYRPLLSAAARLSVDEASLTPEAAEQRLLVLGFRDPSGALRHLEALTAGTNRAAAIQRTLLPVMLGWFADETAPDQGLLTFRKLSDSLGSTHWYLKMLRDEGRAAERLAHVLARSRYAADLLMRAPESVQILAEDTGLEPRDRAAVLATMRSAARRRDDAEAAMQAARVIRRQELFRIALADLVGAADSDRVRRALTDLTDALLEVALHVATTQVGRGRDGTVPADLAVMGLGRLGGRECGYASDADVVVVHRPHDGVDEADAARAATEVVQELRRLLTQAGPDPTLEVDLALRPEGKAGPLSRTVEGYRGYYERWSATWEAQALLRARGVAGDASLQREFVAVVDPVRYPVGGLGAAAVKDIRRLKARMEAERLPRGADPRTHFKLGRGGLSDVEWAVQLLQLQHAHEVAGLRTTSTRGALHAAARAGLVAADDAAQLDEAWCLASALRDATVLWRVRGAESMPSDLRDAEGVARILGSPAGEGGLLGERYLRVARRARAVAERVFYGREGEDVARAAGTDARATDRPRTPSGRRPARRRS